MEPTQRVRPKGSELAKTTSTESQFQMLLIYFWCSHHQTDLIGIIAAADSLIMERRVTGAGKRKGLNPVKQVLVQPQESNAVHTTETLSRLTAGEKESTVSLKRSREVIASAPLDLSVSKAEVGGRCRKQVRNNKRYQKVLSLVSNIFVYQL